jgi:hypothetical protein
MSIREKGRPSEYATNLPFRSGEGIRSALAFGFGPWILPRILGEYSQTVVDGTDIASELLQLPVWVVILLVKREMTIVVCVRQVIG